MATRFRASSFLFAAALALAAFTVIVVGLFLLFQFAAYRSAQKIAREPGSHDAIAGLFAGYAGQFSFVYQLAAAGALVHGFTLGALVSKRNSLRILALIALPLYGLAAALAGLETSAPVLVAASATSLTTFLLLLPGAMPGRMIGRSSKVASS